MIPKQFLLILMVILPAILPAQIQHYTNFQNGDIDGDGTKDIAFGDGYYYNSIINSDFYYIYVAPKNGNRIARTENSEYGVKLLEFNDTINQDLKWDDGSLYFYHGYVYGGGNKWKIPKDYFIGIRLLKNNTTYYGWIRVRGGRKRDAAICWEPDSMIKAGEGIQSIAPIPGKVTDIDNNSVWSDVEVKFYPPYFSSLVKEYRLFIVKSDSTQNLTAENLMALPETKYQVVDTGSVNYRKRLNNDLLDIDGDGMEYAKAYKICILSVSNSPDVFPHDFNLSSSFEIQTVLSKTGKPLALDVNNLGTSEDLNIKFTKNSLEEFTEEYRLQIVPKDSAKNYTLEKGSVIPVENTHSIQTNGDSVISIEGEILVDIYGNSVQQDKMYNAFIYSVPNHKQSNVGSLSNPSNTFCLGVPNYLYAGQKEGEGINYFEFDPVLPMKSALTFDFDDDGVDDFTFGSYEVQLTSRYAGHSKVITENATEIIFTKSEIATNLPEYSTINNLGNWGGGTLFFADTGNKQGEFDFKNEGYIGFRKISDSSIIYGWIQIRALHYAGIIDYAYQNRTQLIANYNFPDTIKTSFVTYPNPNSDRILNIAIKDFNENEEYAIDVLNHSGTKMKEFVIDERQIIVNLKDLPRGLYYVRLRTPREQETQKIMVL